MIARNFICILTSVLVISIFTIAIFSQYIALKYTQQQIKQFSNRLFETEVMYSRMLSQLISSQFNNEMQKFSQYLYLINMQVSKIINGKVKFKEPHISTQMHAEMIYTNQEDPKLLELFKKGPFLTNNWFHYNISKIKELPQQGQDLLKNLTRLEPLTRSLGIQNQVMHNRSSKYIGFDNIFFGFGIDSFTYGLSKNVTYKNTPVQKGCYVGKYSSDFKCKDWYKGAQSSESIAINPPSFYYGFINPYITIFLCQKMLKYNKTLDADVMNNALCLPVKLESLNYYFQNYANSTIQSYLIEPISQKVIYDSTKPFDKYNQKTLSDLELNYLQSENQAEFFNQTLKETFKSKLYQKIQSFSLNQSSSLDQSIIEFEYNRNETKTYVIINPIYLIDKLPQYIGVKKPQPNGYNIYNMFAQINILSNEFLEKNSHELNEFFIRYYLIYIIIFICISVLALIIAINYSLIITRLFNRSINHLIIILNKIQQEQKNIELHYLLENNSSHTQAIFLSKETRKLYESFQTVFQFLLYSSENFFNENQTETLLKLNRNIEFFKQFKNNEAVGITHNNIGSILLQQGHYFQAIEHFQSALIYARYEIQSFIKNNPESTSVILLSNYSFEEISQKNKQKQNRISLQVKSLNSNTIKDEIQKQKFNVKNETSTSFIVGENDQKKGKLIIEEKHQDALNSINFEKNSQRQEIVHKIRKQSLNTDDQQYNKNQQISSPFQIKSTQLLDLKIRDQLSYQQFLSAQVDDHSEERIKLMSNLFYRKQNLIITLIAFQENQDEQQAKNNNQLNSMHFNFWKEIKDLLKKQVIICQFLPFGKKETVEILSLISKCQFNLNRLQKAENTLNFSEKLLKNLQDCYLQFGQEENIQQDDITYSFTNLQLERKSLQSPLIDYGEYPSQQKLRFKQKSHQFTIAENKQNVNSPDSRNKIKTNQLNLTDSSSYTAHENFLLREKFNFQQFEKIDKKPNLFQQNRYLKTQPIIKTEGLSLGLFLNHDQLSNQHSSRKNQNSNKSETNDQYIPLEKQSNSPIFSFDFRDRMTLNKPNTPRKIHQSPFNNNKQRNQNILKNNLTLTLEKDKRYSIDHNRQFKSKSTQNSQRFFNLQKENISQICDLVSLNYSKMFNIKEITINLIKSEFQIKKQNYLESAIFLTSLFESNKFLMSHFPHKIAYQLKNIFDKCNIKSIEFEDFNQKFNQNISMDVVMVYSLKKIDESSNYLQQIQLFKDLAFLVLTSQKDKIGIMVQNVLEDALLPLLKLVQIQQVHNYLDKITEDILYAIIGQSFNFNANFEFNKLKQISFDHNKIFKQINHNQEKQNKVQNDNQLNNSFNKSSENNKSLYKYSDFNDIIQDEGSFSDSLTLPVDVTDQITRNDLYYHDYLLSNANNTTSPIYSFIKFKSQPNNYNENCVIKQKINQNMGDEANQIINRESTLNSQSIQYNIQQQNEKFYESIRQVLDEYYINHIVFRNSLMKHILKINLKLSENIEHYTFNFIQSLKQINNTKDQQQRYIVYVTNKITIQKNANFEKMCQILYYLNIQLIFLCDSKEDNFIEQLCDSEYEYKQRIIIKVFYENSKIVEYLKSQRDNLTNNMHPAFIQHY